MTGRAAHSIGIKDTRAVPIDALTPERCSCSALRQAARHTTRLYDELLSSAGISLNQYSILSKLDRAEPTTISDLAALLVMDNSTLGRLLRPLEARGLIMCEPSLKDRRQKLVSLTAEGSVLLRLARSLWVDAERQFESVLGQTDAVGMRALMRRVIAVRFKTT